MRLSPQPTVPGKTKGIIALDPTVLQCGECSDTLTQERYNLATFIILSGFRFCPSETDGPRRCPACRAAHKTTCGTCDS